jgi:diguanylate cyclase (GGDEF)-like protein/PAS domain S-box-containing protein
MNLNAIEVESVPLKTILTPDVFTVTADDLVGTALLEMKQRSISSVVVVDEVNHPVGIFTEQDAIRLMSEARHISDLKMQEVMSKPVLCVKASMGYGGAYQLMSEHQVRHLVVVDDDNRLLGLVSEGDFLHHLGMEYLIELKTVQGSMSQNVVSLDQTQSVSAALAIMSSKKISCVIATAEGKAVGVLTERDMVKIATEEQDYDLLSIKDRMSSPLITVYPTTPLQDASQLMEQNSVRRLVVVDSSGGLKGLLTRHDIAKSLQGSYIEFLQETLERKKRELEDTETRLRALEQKHFYQELVDQVSDAIYIIDAEDARILDANTQASRLLKYDHGDLLNMRLTEISQLYTSIDDWLNKWMPQIEGGDEQWLISGHRCSDGSILPVEVKARLVKYRNKDYVVAIARDISERLESTKRLKESQQRFQSLFENAPMPYQSLDMEGNILAVNNAWLELLGVSSQAEVVGKNITEFLSHSSLNTLSVEFPKFKETKRVCGPQYEFLRTDGETRYVQVSGQISKDEVTGELRTHCILTDITKQELASRALKESAETYFRVITTALDGFWILDSKGAILEVNESYADMSGYSQDELVHMNVADIDVLENPAKVAEHIKALKENGGQLFTSKHKRKNGEIYDVEVNATYWPGGSGQIFAFIRDITERTHRQDQLRQAATVFANTTEGVMITDPAGRIQRVNKAFCELTGYSEAEVIGQYPSMLQSGRHDRFFYEGMWQQIAKEGYWQGEIWNRRKDGTTYPELLSINAVYDDWDNLEHYVGVFADITHLKESEQELAYLAHHDVLTGLPNRLMIQSQLEQSLGSAQRDGKKLALLLLDLDRFKDVNDSFGHASGDELLQQVADVLRERLRQADVISRMGGDEFAILLGDIKHEEDAGIVADDIIRHLSRRWHLSNGCEVAVGVSVGISLYPTHSLDASSLLQHADAALYSAKSEGRGRFNYFTEELTLDARNRLELEAKLMRAITNNELEVYYQPQLNIESGELIGAEALVRWNDPDRGLVMPGDFIPLAEQTGLVADIGKFVLQSGCRTLKTWLDQGKTPITLAVNLSPVQIRHADMYELVSSVLEETGLDPKYLELELTESALMEREKESIELLQKLRSLGVRIAIDDFGTGYSSLAYLKKFPLDVLKIDKSFVDEIPNDKDDMVIAATIVAMGQNLGIRVLAEGVETQAQLEFLKSKQCHCYQGFLFSPPLPASDFERLINAS